ncbi:MAG: hypothetical protein IPO91_20715 [Chloroflexi bacterium]|nr:hypothetical protein [Chloroflexota bacterium]
MTRVFLDDARAPHPLTPDYLGRTVTPFLSALAVLQLVADTIREQDDPLIIEQIGSENGRLQVCLTGAGAALQFAERELPRWRAQHEDVVRLMNELEEMLSWLGESETRERILIEREDLRVRLQPDLLRLVLDYLSHVSPNVPALGQVVHIDRLLAAFHLLASSALTMAVITT